MSDKSNNLEKAILKTIAYYDLFDYPLTLVEIYQGLWKFKCKLSELVFVLKNSDFLKKYLETKNGFYFLKGRKRILNIRGERRAFSVQKWKKALKAVKIIRFVPFIKTVFLCNSVPYFNTQKDSDIDFFIIIKDSYIWFSRFWITILLHFFKMRRHGKKISNRICLSFYITDKALNLERFYNQNNEYLYHWINDLSPIFDVGAFKDFIRANQWIKNYFPNTSEKEISPTWFVSDNFFSKSIRTSLEKILDSFLGKFINLFLKKIQLFKMHFNRNTRLREDSDAVIVNDQILKFHEAGLEKINQLLSKIKTFNLK